MFLRENMKLTIIFSRFFSKQLTYLCLIARHMLIRRLLLKRVSETVRGQSVEIRWLLLLYASGGLATASQPQKLVSREN